MSTSGDNIRFWRSAALSGVATLIRHRSTEALASRFADQAHFQRAFKRLTAATPGRYLKALNAISGGSTGRR